MGPHRALQQVTGEGRPCQIRPQSRCKAWRLLGSHPPSSLPCHVLLVAGWLPRPAGHTQPLSPVRGGASSRFARSTGKDQGARGKADAVGKLRCRKGTRWERHICQQPGDIGPSHPSANDSQNAPKMKQSSGSRSELAGPPPSHRCSSPCGTGRAGTHVPHGPVSQLGSRSWGCRREAMHFR